MAVTATFNKNGKLYFGGSGLDLDTADLRMVPLTSAYAFNQAHDFINDLTNEVTTNGGTRVALAGESWALSGNNALFDCNDITWTASGGTLTIAQAYLVDYTGSTGDADRELIALFDFGGDASAPAGFDIALQTPSGLFTLS